MSRSRFCVAVLTTLLSLALLTSPSSAIDQKGDRVVIAPQESFSSPFAPVTIRIDYDKERLSVEPQTAIIYVEPEDPNRPSQVLWQVECIQKRHYSPTEVRAGKVSDCLDPKDELVIRPKKGCSTALFGEEIRVEPGHNAVSSGTPNPRVAAELFKKQADVEKLCDGRSRARVEEEMGMKLGGGYDITWVYAVEVVRDGEVILEVDPEVWIEDEGGG